MFDLILKEITSKSASKTIKLATDRKVEVKVRVLPTEIRLTIFLTRF
jgi:hypothetical protein